MISAVVRCAPTLDTSRPHRGKLASLDQQYEQPSVMVAIRRAHSAPWSSWSATSERQDASYQPLVCFRPMPSPKPEVAPPVVRIHVENDFDAKRITSVLEALGYAVLRDLDESAGSSRLKWAVTRVAEQHQLTARECDVLNLVLRGMSNPEIGRALEISRATVKWHLHNIFAKTNTTTREDLLRRTLQLGGSSQTAPERFTLTPTTAVPGPEIQIEIDDAIRRHPAVKRFLLNLQKSYTKYNDGPLKLLLVDSDNTSTDQDTTPLSERTPGVRDWAR